MSLITNNRGLLWVFFGALIALSYFYGDLLLAPNSYMMSASGDGLKNYYTLAYHLEHDSNWLHFEGMNYPYGEHVFYTDGHPLLSLLLWIFPSLGSYSVGLLNILMLLSIPLAAVLIYRIFRVLEIEELPAGIAALSIAFLAPQVWRMAGHFSLAYTFIVPLGILLLIRAVSEPSFKFEIRLGILSLCTFLLHPYLGLMLVMLSGCVWLARSIHQKLFKSKVNWIKLGIATVAPIVLFLVIGWLTDDHPNRTPKPYGFYEYHATFESVFAPGHGLSPFRHMIGQVVPVKTQPWEGWAYVGLASMLTVVGFLLTSLATAIKEKDASRILATFPKPFGYLMIGAVLILLFSMCLPFKWGLEGLAESIAPIRQFRALGRFAWVFYFVFTIMAVYLIARQWKQSRIWTLSLVAVLSLLNFIEGWEPHNMMSDTLGKTPNLFREENLNEQQKQMLKTVKARKYQAIIPIPFFHVGSEEYIYVGTESSKRNAMLMSYHAGVPLFASMTGRASITETLSIQSLFIPTYLKRPFKDRLDDRPVLIMVSEPPEHEELDLISRATYLGDVNGIQFYEMAADYVSYSNRLFPFDRTRSKPAGPEMRSVNDTPFHYVSFDSLDTPVSCRGKGAYKGVKGHYSLFDIPESMLDSGKAYIASFWYRVVPAFSTYNQAFIIERTAGGSENWHSFRSLKEIRYTAGQWGILELPFTVNSMESDYLVCLKGTDNDTTTFYLDELLVRESKDYVYKSSGPASMIFNNYSVKEHR